MYKLFLLVLVWAVAEGTSIMEPKRLVKRGDTIRVCGRMLVDTLSLLCNGEYYDPSEDRIAKRNSLALDPFQNWIAVALSSQDRNEAGFQSVPDQLATPQLYKRFQAGVVDECCRKACSPSTLLSYCRRVE